MLLVDLAVVEVLVQLVVEQVEQEIHLLLVLLKVQTVDLEALDDMVELAVAVVVRVEQHQLVYQVDPVQK
tara:strand:- start:285 stop:494 length:210 start_codon:yes stop_codon:yes gene_type:complete